MIFFLVLNFTSLAKFLTAENSTNTILQNSTFASETITTATTKHDNFIDFMATLSRNSRTGNNSGNFYNKKNDAAEVLPKPEALFGTKSQQKQQQQHNQQQTAPTGAQNAELPVFPERNDAVYFVVAVIGGAKSWGRIMGRTLLEMGPPFGSPMGPPLRPLYIDMPANGK